MLNRLLSPTERWSTRFWGSSGFPDLDVSSALEVGVLDACALVSNPDDVQLQPESPHVRQQFFINKRSTSERELSASNIVHKCTQHRKLQLNSFFSFRKLEIARITTKKIQKRAPKHIRPLKKIRKHTLLRFSWTIKGTLFFLARWLITVINAILK